MAIGRPKKRGTRQMMNLEIFTYYQGDFQLSHVPNVMLGDIIRGVVKVKGQLTWQFQRVVISQRRLRKGRVKREPKSPNKSKQKIAQSSQATQPTQE